MIRERLPLFWKAVFLIAVILLVVNLYTYVTTGYSDKQMTWAFFLVFFLSLGIRFVSERYDRC